MVTNVPVQGGETIAVALDGATLADGHKIVRGELRGVVSEGMLCGLEEVGITEDDAPGQKTGDILRFEEGTTLGTNALDALGFTTSFSTSASPQTVPTATASTKWQKKSPLLSKLLQRTLK